MQNSLSLLTPPAPETARRLCGDLRSCGFDEANLLRFLGGNCPPRFSDAEKRLKAAELAAAGPLGLLLRLFFLEQAVATGEYEAVLDAALRRDLETTGLVQKAKGAVSASALLVPVEDKFIAGDRYAKLAPERDVQHVLAVNPPARFMANMAVRKPAGRLLDLCTGNGVFAALLAARADQVVATDINPRAVALARFNLALNQIGNVTLREGSGFEPVARERFDQIICNPPYIITPSRRFLCTDSEEDLDGFCRKLLLRAPAYLQEGGILQMICEFVEISGQDWRKRLSGWFRDNGCDLWVVCSGVSDIEDYARRRRAQTLADQGEADVGSLADWLTYFRSRGVHAVRSGFIQLRKRHAENWQSFTSLAGPVREPVGAEIEQGFATRDRYHAMASDGILGLRPQLLARPVSLTKAGVESGVRLISGGSLPVSFSVTPGVVALVQRMDGKTQLGKISDAVATTAGVTASQARRQCAEVVRELLCQGLLVA